MYKRYENATPVGTMHLSNCFGIALFEPDEIDKYDCDFVGAWWDCDKGYTGFHKHKVHYSTAGRPFIRKGSLRIYLDNVMRVA